MEIVAKLGSNRTGTSFAQALLPQLKWTESAAAAKEEENLIFWEIFFSEFATRCSALLVLLLLLLFPPLACEVCVAGSVFRVDGIV